MTFFTMRRNLAFHSRKTLSTVFIPPTTPFVFKGRWNLVKGLAWVIRSAIRLAMTCLLNAKPGDALCVIGIVCSSFVAINSATHKRSQLFPLGDTSLPSVRLGNLLVSRNFANISDFFCFATLYNPYIGTYNSCIPTTVQDLPIDLTLYNP